MIQGVGQDDIDYLLEQLVELALGGIPPKVCCF